VGRVISAQLAKLLALKAREGVEVGDCGSLPQAPQARQDSEIRSCSAAGVQVRNSTPPTSDIDAEHAITASWYRRRNRLLGGFGRKGVKGPRAGQESLAHIGRPSRGYRRRPAAGPRYARLIRRQVEISGGHRSTSLASAIGKDGQPPATSRLPPRRAGASPGAVATTLLSARSARVADPEPVTAARRRRDQRDAATGEARRST